MEALNKLGYILQHHGASRKKVQGVTLVHTSSRDVRGRRLNPLPLAYPAIERHGKRRGWRQFLHWRLPTCPDQPVSHRQSDPASLHVWANWPIYYASSICSADHCSRWYWTITPYAISRCVARWSRLWRWSHRLCRQVGFFFFPAQDIHATYTALKDTPPGSRISTNRHIRLRRIRSAWSVPEGFPRLFYLLWAPFKAIFVALQLAWFMGCVTPWPNYILIQVRASWNSCWLSANMFQR